MVADENTDEVIVPCVYVDTAKVEDSAVAELVSEGKIVVVDDIKLANFILVKTKMAVSKVARELSKTQDIPLLPISDLK